MHIKYRYTNLLNLKYMFDLKAKGLTTPEKFVVWWNETHPDFQITWACVAKVFRPRLDYRYYQQSRYENITWRKDIKIEGKKHNITETYKYSKNGFRFSRAQAKLATEQCLLDQHPNT
ncbi:5731_t:CDS:2 [Ambispora gerdemannii]|uniref:5731_t:CDS:1 n=1 Tax=Ambispora gerdemannii TaxID=144530 RepID=A0A9N8WF24_9GLOM|nr:5731_t:CDS:2 [Ambispora gerdemannii]